MTDIGPVFLVLAIFGILAGFFKHLFVKVLITLIIMTGLFVLFPELLIKYAEAVAAIRQALA